MNIYLDDSIEPVYHSITFHPGWSLRALLAAIRAWARSTVTKTAQQKIEESKMWTALRDAIFNALLPFPDAHQQVGSAIAAVYESFKDQPA
ncbi:MAG: hypothetical protein U0Q16_33295 [Bryobacteraceae bacterium]